jgi:hypothetical protein
MENNELMAVENNAILDFSTQTSSNTSIETHSTIKDPKVLFNLETSVDVMLNDIVGEQIRVKDVVIRKYFKPMEKPEVDPETGEVIKDTEMSVSCVLIDESGKSYATGSKTFAFDMMKYLGQYGGVAFLENGAGIDIRIIKKPVGEKGNKALSFELI